MRQGWLFAAHATGTVRATYRGVGSAPERYTDTRPGGFRAEAGYAKGLASDVIAEIRDRRGHHGVRGDDRLATLSHSDRLRGVSGAIRTRGPQRSDNASRS